MARPKRGRPAANPKKAPDELTPEQIRDIAESNHGDLPPPPGEPAPVSNDNPPPPKDNPSGAFIQGDLVTALNNVAALVAESQRQSADAIEQVKGVEQKAIAAAEKVGTDILQQLPGVVDKMVNSRLEQFMTALTDKVQGGSMQQQPGAQGVVAGPPVSSNGQKQSLIETLLPLFAQQMLAPAQPQNQFEAMFKMFEFMDKVGQMRQKPYIEGMEAATMLAKLAFMGGADPAKVADAMGKTVESLHVKPEAPVKP